MNVLELANDTWVVTGVLSIFFFLILSALVIGRWPDLFDRTGDNPILRLLLLPIILLSRWRSARRWMINLLGVIFILWITQFAIEWIQPALTPEDVFPPPLTGPRAVEAQIVERGPVLALATYTGSALPYESIAIYSRVDGTIEELNVYEGTKVSEGMQLARLDTSQLTPPYEKALAELKFWNAEWDRAQELFDDRVISALERDRIRMSYESAAAQTRQMKAQLQYATIRAPVDGWVAKRKAFKGQYIHKGEMLFRLDRLDALRIQFNVSERDLPFIQKGDPVWLEFPQMSLLAFNRGGWSDRVFPTSEKQIADTFGDETEFIQVAQGLPDAADPDASPGMRGEVMVVFPSVDPKTHTGIVEVHLDNPGVLIKSDSYVVGHFAVERVGDVLRVPSRAIMQLPDGKEVVYMAPAFSDEGNAEIREVQVGLRANGYVEIKSGIEENEFVIDRGQRNLADGEYITVVKRRGGF